VVGRAQSLAPGPARLADRWNDARGGLGSHWRAWRYRHRLWRPFHRQVQQWLEAWDPATRTLILVGPSAGYALDGRFLARFDRCVVLEPDPLARWLLKRRFTHVPWQFAREDVFHDPQALERISERWPGAAVLFCNVIGQVFSADELHRWLAQQAPWLAAHTWASWHDVFSSSVAPQRLPTAAEAACGADASVDVARALWRGQACAVEDHGSFGWPPYSEFALWRLTPNQWHVIGWTAHPPP